jgi:hypothetical protein
MVPIWISGIPFEQSCIDETDSIIKSVSGFTTSPLTQALLVVHVSRVLTIQLSYGWRERRTSVRKGQ